MYFMYFENLTPKVLFRKFDSENFVSKISFWIYYSENFKRPLPKYILLVTFSKGKKWNFKAFGGCKKKV